MQCPRCGQENPDTASECRRCSNFLRQQARTGSNTPATDKPAAGAAGEDRRALLGAVIGRNGNFYLPRFERLERGDAKIGWHWPAFFFTFLWLLYRKMWLWAALYTIVPGVALLLLLVALSIAGIPIQRASAIAYGVFYAAIFLLPPLFATTLYYRHCKQKIDQVQQHSREHAWQLGWLTARGGTSVAALWVLLVFTIPALLGILAAIALPAYQDYATRARVAEATALGYRAATDVAGFYVRTRLYPRTMQEAGFDDPGSPLVAQYGLDPTDGSIELRLTFDPVRGGRLYFFPRVSENGDISIVCASPDIPAKYLSPECR